MSDKRKVFFTSLLAVLLIVSNIVSSKITVVLNLPLNCSLFVYPFCFLFVLCITDLYGKKEAKKSVIYAITIQIITFIIFTLIVMLPNQANTIMNSNALQSVVAPNYIELLRIYTPNLYQVVGSLLGFLVSQFILIQLYDFVKNGTFKFIAVAISLLFSMVIDIIIFVPIYNISNEIVMNEIILNMIYRLIVYVILTFIMSILALIFTKKKN